MISLPIEQSKVVVTSLRTIPKFKENMVEKAVKGLHGLLKFEETFKDVQFHLLTGPARHHKIQKHKR